MSDIETLFNFLDGYDFGPEWSDIIDPIQKAAEKEYKENTSRIKDAERLIEFAYEEIMTMEQLSKWRGVRAWMEDV